MAAAMIVGAAVMAMGQLQQGQAAGQAAEFNATIARQNAGIALQQGESDAKHQGEINYRRLGAIRAGYGASGVTMDGSPLDVLESSARMAELDTQNIRYNAKLKAMGFTNSASLDDARADNARTSSIYKAAGTSLMGGAQAYAMRGTGSTIRVNDNYVGDFETV